MFFPKLFQTLDTYRMLVFRIQTLPALVSQNQQIHCEGGIRTKISEYRITSRL